MEMTVKMRYQIYTQLLIALAIYFFMALIVRVGNELWGGVFYPLHCFTLIGIAYIVDNAKLKLKPNETRLIKIITMLVFTVLSFLLLPKDAFDFFSAAEEASIFSMITFILYTGLSSFTAIKVFNYLQAREYFSE
ncbi:hypothetical protein A1QO_04030 [Vibrio genomosp. F10 str. ZF-129]|uniref:Uncharacterized protein n=1 Tax=Vibrio genomosp. F10 str. ZF-129 TaxID=1187848 RepID=A0A1E5BIQ5_9VIBR|nr:hypothetical protein [Vibrio genomosp. F10]OEE37280.1 hypothetical protein A1QO_04030 [Vibrio genomosp. F10 str. ZF-129]